MNIGFKFLFHPLDLLNTLRVGDSLDFFSPFPLIWILIDSKRRSEKYSEPGNPHMGNLALTIGRLTLSLDFPNFSTTL